MKKVITVTTTEGKFSAEKFSTDGRMIILKNVASVYGDKTAFEDVKSFPVHKIIDVEVE